MVCNDISLHLLFHGYWKSRHQTKLRSQVLHPCFTLFLSNMFTFIRLHQSLRWKSGDRSRQRARMLAESCVHTGLEALFLECTFRIWCSLSLLNASAWLNPNFSPTPTALPYPSICRGICRGRSFRYCFFKGNL